jgi:hypothetical protein
MILGRQDRRRSSDNKKNTYKFHGKKIISPRTTRPPSAP